MRAEGVGPLLFVVDSQKPLERLVKDLEAAVARHKFGVLGVHDLRAKLAEKGVPFDRECRVFEVCNPQQARKVLEANLEISTALPCRISVYSDGGKTRLATIKPTALIALYGTSELKAVAEDVERTIEAIMTDAAQ